MQATCTIVPSVNPRVHRETRPLHPALVMAGSGETVSFAELDARANRLAQVLHGHGLRPGDGVAVLLENSSRVFDCYWAAIRSGLYLTPINAHLGPDEAAYIIEDCGAKALITSCALRDLAVATVHRLGGCSLRLMVDGAAPGFEAFEDLVDEAPDAPLEEEVRGETMLYSSGTTGRPKGIRRPLSGLPLDQLSPNAALANRLWGMDADTRYLSPAPLYHAAPLGFTSSVQALGGTAVVMEAFDARAAIGHIDSHAITHSQWVPTMFSRMLKLDPGERDGLDGSTHRVAVHAAAPCPIEVKRQMIEWWGPILCEYYAGTEMNGFVHCTSEEWLTRPGTVGRSILGTIHICDDRGVEVPTGESGTVYFEREVVAFEYHNDPAKTRRAQHPDHPTWSALGDIGHVDDDGYLFLTDRSTFMIISGGVNIYPQEIENELILHPAVADVAVFGVPHPDLGEQVKAVVEPARGVTPDEELGAELIRWLGDRVARYKLPRSLDFAAELPRSPTGKLYKKALRDPFWAAGDRPIA